MFCNNFFNDSIEVNSFYEERPIEIKLNEFIIDFNHDQKQLMHSIAKGIYLNIALGSTGVGKTTAAIIEACNKLVNRQISSIIFTRPQSSFFSRSEKISDPYMEILNLCLGKNNVKKLIKYNIIKFVSIQSLEIPQLFNTLIICDNSQYITKNELNILINKLNRTSKIVLLADTDLIYNNTQNLKKEFSEFINDIYLTDTFSNLDVNVIAFANEYVNLPTFRKFAKLLKK
ncbi:MAG: hypothetical protein [Bacteriophage sp.]|nr:MAG: hypothetical protein [Bacteriophage sp.]